jgi:hypothetical protein
MARSGIRRTSFLFIEATMKQPLSQTQIIRSLGEALEWLEKETQWGVPAGEHNHLTGRIGELYAAMVTRGQMALSTNQRGYDVVSADSKRISVKTVTTTTASEVLFNESTFYLVDRVMIFRIVTDGDEVSIEEIEDCTASEIVNNCKVRNGKYIYPIKSVAVPGGVSGRRMLTHDDTKKLEVTGRAIHKGRSIIQYENGTVLVETDSQVADVTLPVLREIALDVGVDFLNNAGNKKNTRTFGSDIIKALNRSAALR